MLSGSTMEMPRSLQMPSMQRLVQEHSLYEKRLQMLRAKPFPTEQEQLEEVELKKWKLRLKDAMERMQRETVSLSRG